MKSLQSKSVLKVLDGEAVWPPPVWIMRQAGRYLPEYRELRATTSSFLDFCYSPAKAAEATLQPIRRFGFDAAIMFSDILVVPHALGQRLEFIEGEGPWLEPIRKVEDFSRLSETLPLERLEPVFETLDRVKGLLPPGTTLLGFCGAPWTLASYMIAGKGTPDQAPARLMAYTQPDFMRQLIDRLVEASSLYLIRQIDAGAEAVQIFESFGAALSAPLFEPLSLDPIRRIIHNLKTARPHAKVVLFVRGIGFHLHRLASTGCDAVGLDWTVPLDSAFPLLPLPTQGNLDPLAVVAGGEALRQGADVILEAGRGQAHIFNLGHGIVPETPVPHVEALLKQIRAA